MQILSQKNGCHVCQEIGRPYRTRLTGQLAFQTTAKQRFYADPNRGAGPGLARCVFIAVLSLG